MLKDASPLLKICMLILIFAMFVFAVWKLYQLYQLKNSGETSQAIIERYEEQRSQPQSLTNFAMAYAPVFSFTTESGEKIEKVSSNFEEEKAFQIGDSVLVYYPKEKPYSAKIDGEFPWKFYGILALLGLIGCGLLIYYLAYPPTSKF